MEIAANEDEKVVQLRRGNDMFYPVSSDEKKSNDVHHDLDKMPCILYAQRYLSSNIPHPMQITPLSSALIDTSNLVSVQAGLPHIIHGFQTQFNTNESSGLYISSCSPNFIPTVSFPLSTDDRGMSVRDEDKLTLAGKALAIAGPNPFQSAVTPSAAINFRAQSRKPEYVP